MESGAPAPIVPPRMVTVSLPPRVYTPQSDRRVEPHRRRLSSASKRAADLPRQHLQFGHSSLSVIVSRAIIVGIERLYPMSSDRTPGRRYAWCRRAIVAFRPWDISASDVYELVVTFVSRSVPSGTLVVSAIAWHARHRRRRRKRQDAMMASTETPASWSCPGSSLYTASRLPVRRTKSVPARDYPSA